MRGSHLNCGRFVRTLIRPMTNNTLQHGLSEMFFRCYSGTPLIWPPLSRKKLAVLARAFLQENVLRFLPGSQKKSGRNNEVAVLQRGGRKAGGSTVTINSRTKLAHCRLWAVSLFLRAFPSCSNWIVALMLLPYKLLITIIGTHSCQRSLRTTFYLENLFKKLSSGVKILRSFFEVDQNIYNKANKSTSMWHPKVTDFFALSVLDFQKKIFGPAGPQVFIFGRQNKYFSRQKLYLRTNGIQ